MLSPRALAGTLALALGLVASAAGAIEVPLTVHEMADHTRDDARVRMGVPFPQGAVPDVSALGVDGPAGPVGLSQASVLGSWHDGSVRWALMEFGADVAAGGTAQYTVHSNGNASGPSPLVATEDASGVTVETGVVRFTVGKGDFRVVQELAIDADGNGSYETPLIAPGSSAGLVLTAGGSEYAPRTPDTVTLESLGPVRATILVEGDFGYTNGEPLPLRYVLRLEAFANSGELRAQLTLHNPNKGSLSFDGDGSQYFDDLRIELDTTLGSPQLRAGRDKGQAAYSQALGSGRFRLHQDSSGDPTNWDRYATRKNVSFRGWKAWHDNSEVSSGDRAEGWLEIGDGQVVAAAAVQEFWQNFPNTLDAHSDGRLAARVFSEASTGSFHLRGGEQKTHVMFFRFAADGGSATRDVLVSAMNPMPALASPQYYAGTGCFKRFLPLGESTQYPQFDDWEAMQRATIQGGEGYRSDKNIYTNKDDDDLYGWLDWGDHRADYEHNGDRANGENDLSANLVLQMARSGDPRWWEHAEPLARHLADIDVYHTTQEDGGWDWRNGGFFEHDRTGTNRHRGVSFPQPNHYNAHGMFLVYYMTGDPVVKSSALEVAYNAKWRVDRRSGGYSYVDSEELRSPAWMLNVVTEGWKLTHDPGLLATAQDIIDRVHPDTRCWPWGPGCASSEIKGIYKNYINMWELGMLMISMGDLFDEFQRAGIPVPTRGIEGLQHYGTFIQERTWVESEQIFGKRWNWSDGSIGTDSAPGNILRVIDGLVHAYRHTGDATLLNHLPEAWATATANPWYVGSGVTYADLKMQSTVARNGNSYMQFVHEQAGGGASCLQLSSTNPADGGQWDVSAGDLLLAFDANVDATSLQGGLSVTGSQSGPIAATANVSGSLATVSLGSLPIDGETLTVTLSATVRGSAGGSLDGNGDGNCGDPWSMSVTVAGGASAGDTQAPAAVSDLQLFFDPGTGNGLVLWSAPGDDVGVADIELRQMVVAPGSSFDWDSAQPTPVDPEPLAEGEPMALTVPRIDADTGMWQVALRSRDAAGNWSELSNVAADATGPEVKLDEDAGRVREVAPGVNTVVQVYPTDSWTGSGQLTALRWRWADEPASAWRDVPLELSPRSGSEGLASIELDLSGMGDGQQRRFLVQAQDAAGNWSPQPAAGDVVVDDPLELLDDCPAPLAREGAR